VEGFKQNVGKIRPRIDFPGLEVVYVVGTWSIDQVERIRNGAATEWVR
jgi:hypothetical protein